MWKVYKYIDYDERVIVNGRETYGKIVFECIANNNEEAAAKFYEETGARIERLPSVIYYASLIKF